ncbi:arginine deiminase family protein [Sediminitomix flava]|uniref:arginine deiminase n=1 Tax=Sediminitomix flava TaxID=379075 RepID=A0A315ZAA0_SEDFL|nr:arginine deiminase family protein [Sediminitomix flava]PWJ42202.1 arginine deiminase [Sediminitomix flava]
MEPQLNPSPIFVDSEIGTLKRLLIHSPDEGLGKVIPMKAQDWLFDDIIHLDTMRKNEYDYYLKLLLYFLDYENIHGRMSEVDSDEDRSFYKPDHPNYYNSKKVLDPQYLLSQVLDNPTIRERIVASICTHEGVSYRKQLQLMEMSSLALSRTLISGLTPEKEMLFPPVPNLIFTRDVGITIKDHILLNRPAKLARTRESIIMRHIFFHHPIFNSIKNNVIEIEDQPGFFLLEEDEQDHRRITLEGGDVMMVAPNHVLIGVSERTSSYAAERVVKELHARDLVEKVTVIKIPAHRSCMHIDTVFTQIKRDTWVMFGEFSGANTDFGDNEMVGLHEPDGRFHLEIFQYVKGKDYSDPIRFEHLESLLHHITRYDLGCNTNAKIIYSGNKEFPYGRREQWTDSCNMLALKEGVVIGYDRNDKTIQAIENAGMKVIEVSKLLELFDCEELHPDDVENTLILLPSAELSRARGGSHCMSMPIQRDGFM